MFKNCFLTKMGPVPRHLKKKIIKSKIGTGHISPGPVHISLCHISWHPNSFSHSSYSNLKKPRLGAGFPTRVLSERNKNEDISGGKAQLCHWIFAQITLVFDILGEISPRRIPYPLQYTIPWRLASDFVGSFKCLEGYTASHDNFSEGYLAL